MLRQYCAILFLCVVVFVCVGCAGRDIDVRPKGQASVGVGAGGSAHMDVGVGF